MNGLGIFNNIDVSVEADEVLLLWHIILVGIIELSIALTVLVYSDKLSFIVKLLEYNNAFHEKSSSIFCIYILNTLLFTDTAKLCIKAPVLLTI
jgi:hypothetical protein